MKFLSIIIKKCEFKKIIIEKTIKIKSKQKLQIKFSELRKQREKIRLIESEKTVQFRSALKFFDKLKFNLYETSNQFLILNMKKIKMIACQIKKT